MAAQAETLQQAAADVLRRSCRGEGTRQVLYAVNVPPAVKSQLQAIVLGCQNNEPLLWSVARDSGFMHNVHPEHLEPDNKLLLVVLYEALLGSRRVRGTSKIVELVKRHKALLQQQLANHRKSGKAAGHQEKIRLPRYVRVNTLKASLEEAIAHFEKRGYKLAAPEPGASNLVVPGKGAMIKDMQVPNLLALPAGSSLHKDPLVERGAVILQDRSSCLSAAALAPIPAGAVIADACAAPGNKTSHAAAQLVAASGSCDVCAGRVLAFERDPKRERMLRRQMRAFGFDSVVNVRGRDFLSAVEEALAGAKNAEADMMRQVTHVLVDPSCSGSGLVAQYHGSASGVVTGEERTAPGASADGAAAEHDARTAPEGDYDIGTLAAEQEKLVLAAMALPQARVVVYSTCSVHRQENEDVVQKILVNAPKGFSLVRALPQWPHRGIAAAGDEIAPLVVRATHDKDSTNGFFVARFERMQRPEEASGGKRQLQTADAAGSKRPKHKLGLQNDEAGRGKVATERASQGNKVATCRVHEPPATADAAHQTGTAGQTFSEYRPTAPATRPWAIHKVLHACLSD